MKTKQIIRYAAWLFALVLGLSVSTAHANNIQITSKPRMFNKNSSDGTLMIGFSLQWENSWKVNKPNNWDAAWVFVKFRESSGDWKHVYIDTNASAHRASAMDGVKTVLKVGMSDVTDAETLKESRKATGVFLYRAENGKGTIKFDSVNLKWNYKAQDLDDESVISLRIFAIEMVYIPEEAYTIGDNTSTYALRLMGDKKRLVRISDYQIEMPGPSAWGLYKNLSVTSENVTVKAWGGETGHTHGTWYKTSTQQGLSVYAEIPKNAWQAVTYPMAWGAAQHGINGGSGWTYHSHHAPSYGNRDGWHTFRVRMPYPYKASEAYFSWWNSYPPYGFYVRASTDSVKWETIAGTTATNISYAHVTRHALPITNPKPYTWYEFNIYTNTYLILAAWGLTDKNTEGFAENNIYYGVGKYDGGVPLYYTHNDVKADSNYPNGYKAFYIMKHELTQEAYVNFLNTLTVAQQNYLANQGAPNLNPARSKECFRYARNWIRVKENIEGSPLVYGCYVTDAPGTEGWNPEQQAGNVAMNGLDWYANAAYLAWAALRPLTELEYEKACRGTSAAVAGEYAWGTASYNATDPAKAAKNPNMANEMVSTVGANMIVMNGSGKSQTAQFPMRVGCLATPTSNRTEAGASFYGVLNLSDNVTEYYVNFTTAEGRKYTGDHGSGMLGPMGEARQKNWPDNVTAKGSGFRGHSPVGGVVYARVSDRYYAETVYGRSSAAAFSEQWHMGCRGGRTAPR